VHLVITDEREGNCKEMSESVIEKVESMKTIVKETKEEVLNTETNPNGVKDKESLDNFSFHKYMFLWIANINF
jgi:predicted polyphosphate/ATP-dependent NAD kinase